MKTAYLIRHSRPDFPKGQRMCLGSTDLPLGDAGRVQSQAMAAGLPPVTRVFSSPLIRAVETALAIGQPVTILPGLRELDAGEWEGLTFQQIRQQYPQLYAARGEDPQLPIPGAEDKQAGLARFSQAMVQAGQASPGDFAVVSHGGIEALFLQAIGGGVYKPDYAEIIPLTYCEGRYYFKEQKNHA